MANDANVCDPILILAHMAVSLYIVYIMPERGWKGMKAKQHLCEHAKNMRNFGHVEIFGSEIEPLKSQISIGQWLPETSYKIRI